MSKLTPEGQQLVGQFAERHGFSEEAVARMLAAVTAGQGRMAQFDHPQFGGSGQWMSGGMLMLGDMFNQSLKAKVNGLCTDLAQALAAAGPLTAPAQSQSQSQSQYHHQDENRDNHQEDMGVGSLPENPFFEPSHSNSWWPTELGKPSAVGSQNAIRYAYFDDARRLVVERNGSVKVHDTLDHRIGGFSQQQGGSDGISMSSQHGTIDLMSLPVVAQDALDPVLSTTAMPKTDASSSPARDEGVGTSTTSMPTAAAHDDPLQLIERMGQLHERGLLTDEEFSAKKQELLSRL